MNNDLIKNLANLARIEVPEESQESMAKDMISILKFVDEIQNVDVGNTDLKTDRTNIFREDVVAPIDPHHDLVTIAPQNQDHFVKVPKVI